MGRRILEESSAANYTIGVRYKQALLGPARMFGGMAPCIRAAILAFCQLEPPDQMNLIEQMAKFDANPAAKVKASGDLSGRSRKKR